MLYSIDDKIDAILDMVANCEELDAVQEQLFKELQEDITQYIDVMLRKIRNEEGVAKALRAEAKLLAERAREHEDKEDKTKERLLARLKKLGIEKHSGDILKVSVCASPPKLVPPSTIDFKKLDDRFKQVVVMVNTSAIMTAHKANEKLPEGFSVTSGEHLRISPV